MPRRSNVLRGLSPRMRGNQHLPDQLDRTASEGLSPRMRGNRILTRLERGHSSGVGSIPAHAGEPPTTSGSCRWSSRVYPRACGGTGALHRTPSWLERRLRSIPAHAGEPLVIKSLNFPKFFTMSKSVERFWSPLFAFYKQNPVSVHDLLRGFAEGFYAEISNRFRITPNQDNRPRAKRLPPS